MAETWEACDLDTQARLVVCCETILADEAKQQEALAALAISGKVMQ